MEFDRELLEVMGRGRERVQDEKLVLFILADVTGHSLAPRETCWGGRRGGLAREGPPEGGGGGAFVSRAAAGTLPGTDGLQHPTFSLFQHVFLGRETKGRVSRHLWTPRVTTRASETANNFESPL